MQTPLTRALYKGFKHETIESSVAIEKVIGEKRSHLTNLVIRNYDLPKTPLYVPVAGQGLDLDLFSVADER